MKQISTGIHLILLSTGIACGFSHQRPFSRTKFPCRATSRIHHHLPNGNPNPPSSSLIFSNTASTTKSIIPSIRGGFRGSSSSNDVATSPDDFSGGSSTPSLNASKIVNILASLWGAGGVIMILRKSIVRILPIAMEPFGAAAPFPLTTFQLGSYIAMCVWFAYVEGYKGFQLKFSPLVVSRALTLKPMDGTPIHHTLLGPFYAMGLFHATKKRKIVSWSVTIGVAVIVAAVKRLSYPWRNIIDAGVIVGLTWGSLSIAIEWMKVVLGNKTPADPALP